MKIPLKRISYDELTKLSIEQRTQLFIKDKEIERLNNIIEDVYSSIYHELYGHILNNDEDSWLPKYYTNNKLDYRKLLIGLLSDYENRLSKGISKDFDIYEN